MKNTYVKCEDWSWEDKLLYIKACIGDTIPHNKICGYATLGKDELLSPYRNAWYIYCCGSGMIDYDGKTNKPATGGRVEVKLSDLKQEKPKPTKFVKVEESIFDLKEEFERGELYVNDYDGHHTQILDEKNLFLAAFNNSIYRQVEIDWRDELVSFVDSCECLDLDVHLRCFDKTPAVPYEEKLHSEFISLCHRVAELTDKPE